MNSQFPQIPPSPPHPLGQIRNIWKICTLRVAESIRIYPEEAWLWFPRAHPRDDLLTSSTSSEAETFHKLTDVVKANVRKKAHVRKKNNVNGTKNVSVGESIIKRQYSSPFWT